MALRRIVVVDESPAIRETVSILLGSDYEIQAFSLNEYLSVGPSGRAQPSLIIAGTTGRIPATTGMFPPDVPVLWLLDVPHPSSSPAPATAETLPRRFSPFELRRRVDELLAQPPPLGPADHARQRLRPPYVPKEAARVIAEALANDLPFLLCGEPGTGKRSVARALHTVRGGGAFLAVRGDAFCAHSLSAEPARHGTVFIDGVDRLTDEGQLRLLTCLQPNGMLLTPDGVRMRLVTTAENQLVEAMERRQFSPELYYRLTVLKAQLHPLRGRAEDIPALAQALAKELAFWLGIPTVTFTAAALERLSKYLWFGNLAELEAVLARTLSLNRRAVVDASDLLFETTRLPASPGGAVSDAGSPLPRPELTRQILDMIINELAHEFKNPLVTIKTFAERLRRILHDGADEEHFARLTGDAVDRMDHVLENLLQFTRFGAPVPEVVSPESLLGAALEDVPQLCAFPAGRIEFEVSQSTPIFVDTAQATYALTNLLQPLTRGLDSRGTVRIRCAAPGEIVIGISMPGMPLGGQLATMLDSADRVETPLPLGVAIAQALIERNGGTLAFEPANQPTTVVVRFPVAEQEEAPLAGNGKAPRSSS